MFINIYKSHVVFLRNHSTVANTGLDATTNLTLMLLAANCITVTVSNQKFASLLFVKEIQLSAIVPLKWAWLWAELSAYCRCPLIVWIGL